MKATYSAFAGCCPALGRGLIWGALAIAGFGVPARANLVIQPVYSSDISPDAQVVIQSAIKFYADNFKGNVTVTVGFGSQAGGGASATYGIEQVSYTEYLKQLKGNLTEGQTDVSALASLPAASPLGNGQIIMTETLAANLGLGVQNAAAVIATGSNCAGLSVQACVAYGAAYLTGGANNTPSAGLFGVTEHEINEVLGTASSLSSGATATVASAADLFRYSALNTRSWSNNPSTGTPCGSGTPDAYLSVDGGKTNAAAYNNCNNGGDYGDFQSPGGTPQVQDAFGPTNNPTFLTLTSPEAILLDAAGWNYVSSRTVAVGTPSPVTEKAVFIGSQIEGVSTPEPSTIFLLGTGLAAFCGFARRRSRA